MDNKTLELEIKKILSEENFFDMLLKINDFTTTYKTSDFYKKTKMPLVDVVKYYKGWNVLSFNGLKDSLQKLINSLNFDNINKILDEFTSVFAAENNEIMDLVNNLYDFRDIIKETNEDNKDNNNSNA